MNRDEWNKFCNVFQLDVKVTVPKKVTRTDIIQTLCNEGDFIFKGKGDSITMINLKHLEGKGKAEKQMSELLWGQVQDYLKKRDADQKSSEVKK